MSEGVLFLFSFRPSYLMGETQPLRSAHPPQPHCPCSVFLGRRQREPSAHCGLNDCPWAKPAIIGATWLGMLVASGRA